MKKALIVGINDYAPVGAGGPDLRGCINDASCIANTLVTRCGFPSTNIRILTDRNATRMNILRYLQWLLMNCKAGDSLVFYYSGHGTRLVNIGPDIEIDGFDEAICPHDYATAGCIRDDDFSAIFRSLLKPKVNLDVMFDSCFAGTATRDFGIEEGNENEMVYNGIRYIPPMLDDAFHFTFENQLDESVVTPKSTKVIVIVPEMNHVLWSACRDNQVSQEGNIGGRIRGYFTYCLCNALYATGGNILRYVLDNQIKGCLAALKVSQINQTEGPRSELLQKIFT